MEIDFFLYIRQEDNYARLSYDGLNDIAVGV